MTISLLLVPGKPAIPECVILRELVYAFQGIEGEMIKLDPVNEGYSISNQVRSSLG